jgi:bifunctional DNA-binding transcriptional regulator/antitoxin component of YhaV-PrlF toxin-antitoxin module
MNTVFQVRVQRGGSITLPRELRDNHHIGSGDTLTLLDLGGGLVVISPKGSRVDQIADQLAAEWREDGVSLDSLLSTLRQVRKDRHDENP